MTERAGLFRTVRQTTTKSSDTVTHIPGSAIPPMVLKVAALATTNWQPTAAKRQRCAPLEANKNEKIPF